MRMQESVLDLQLNKITATKLPYTMQKVKIPLNAEKKFFQEMTGFELLLSDGKQNLETSESNECNETYEHSRTSPLE